MPQASVLKRGQVQNHSCESDFSLSFFFYHFFLLSFFFYYHANKTHFHKKGFAHGLVLRESVFGSRKWPILHLICQCVPRRLVRKGGVSPVPRV